MTSHETRLTRFGVLVVGGGPGGMAAACAAAESGAQVAVVDDGHAPGGQIWRGSGTGADVEETDWRQRFARSSTLLHISGSRVIGMPDPGVLEIEGADGGARKIGWDRLVLATGARELFLPFPGWTLPQVMGAGGLQALVKGGWPIVGRRVLVAGSGPLLLAVAAGLRKAGASVVCIVEQANWSRLSRFGASLWRCPSKIAQAMKLQRTLGGVPFRAGWWPHRVDRVGHVIAVSITNGSSSMRIEADLLACGWGLIPSVELPALLGCRIEGGRVAVDDRQRTSVPSIFAAGEATGIGGLDKAISEGVVAGRTAAGLDPGRPERRRRDHWRSFAARLARAYAIRPEVTRIADDSTIVCRCEDVAFGAIRGYGSWREAKLQTRCGMGPCQGRICGAATEAMLGWGMESVRPPLLAARVASLMTSNNEARKP